MKLGKDVVDVDEGLTQALRCDLLSGSQKPRATMTSAPPAPDPKMRHLLSSRWR